MEFGQNKVKQLKRRLKRNPGAYDPNLKLGVFYLERENLSTAVQFLEKACCIRKDQPDLHFLLANTYKVLGDLGKSEQYFKSALALQPQNDKFRHNYGQLLQESERWDAAIDVYKEAVEMEPQNFETLNDIGIMYFNQKQYKQSIDYLKRAIKVNGDYFVARLNLAYVYLEAHEISAAEKTLELLEAIHPNDKEVRELRIRFNSNLNRVNKMKEETLTDLTFSENSLQISPLRIIKNFNENGSCHDIGLSIVIPVRDELENIPILYKELIEALQKLKENYEIIFIDDGSVDGSGSALSELAAENPVVKVIQFRRNYGQTAAMNAGFKFSRGSVVITMDADLQNDPADIPLLLEKMAEGYDLVSGWRKHRKDTMITRKLPSAIANYLINWLIYGTGVQLHDFGCTLKAYKRGIIKNINLYGEMHRFIPVFAAWLGVKVAEIPVNHRARIHGQAKYNLSRVSRVIFDLIVVRFFSDYMTRPIQFFGRIAKVLGIYGFSALIVLSLLGLSDMVAFSANTFIVLASLLLFAMMQIISIGLLGEIMIRSYFEGQDKDYYVVEKILNEGR